MCCTKEDLDFVFKQACLPWITSVVLLRAAGLGGGHCVTSMEGRVTPLLTKIVKISVLSIKTEWEEVYHGVTCWPTTPGNSNPSDATGLHGHKRFGNPGMLAVGDAPVEKKMLRKLHWLLKKALRN